MNPAEWRWTILILAGVVTWIVAAFVYVLVAVLFAPMPEPARSLAALIVAGITARRLWPLLVGE